MEETQKYLIKQIKELLDDRDYVGAKNQLEKLIVISEPIG